LHWLPGAIAALALRRPSWFTVVGFVTFRRIVEFLNVYASRGCFKTILKSLVEIMGKSAKCAKQEK
jgi:hypothetical protein